MTRTTFEAQIPFSGFYNSIHDSELDRVWESECEYFAEKTGHDMPEFICDEYWRAIEWGNVHLEYAKEYVESFLEWLGLDGEYLGMVSPREYNFAIDRVFAKLTRDDIARLFTFIKRDELAELVKERFTSRDGFISNYSPNLAEWGRVSSWDHNQIGTLVLCAANAQNSGYGRDGFDSYGEYELMESAIGNGMLDNWIWGSSERATRLSNITYYLRQRGQRKIKTMVEWHKARRSENRPFDQTPLGKAMSQ